MKDKFLSHETFVYFITTDDPNEVRDLFIRLQAGTPLTAQDKRDAWPGEFTEFVLTAGGKDNADNYCGWHLFTKIAKLTKDFDRRSLVAQCFMLFYNIHNNIGFCDIHGRDIDAFYHEHVDFDRESKEAKDFEKVCDLLFEQFKGHPKLAGYHMIDLILYVDAIFRSDYISGWESKLPDALDKFAERCRRGGEVYKENKDTEDITYSTQYLYFVRNGANTGTNIRKRQDFFARKMDNLISLTPKDRTRTFSERDRLRIFYRDDQKCQHCAMIKETHRVDWPNAKIHHTTPHNEDGDTAIEYGALVHKNCHPTAPSAVKNFREWWETNALGLSVKEEQGTQKQTRSRILPPDGTQARFYDEGKTYLAEIRNRKIHSLNSEFKPERAFSPVIKKITGKSWNGWDCWEIKLPDTDRWILASTWRYAQSLKRPY